MAQKAQLAPQMAAPIPADPYQQYLQYQMYQQMDMPQAAAYAPFAMYSPVYRGRENYEKKKNFLGNLTSENGVLYLKI